MSVSDIPGIFCWSKIHSLISVLKKRIWLLIDVDCHDCSNLSSHIRSFSSDYMLNLSFPRTFSAASTNPEKCRTSKLTNNVKSITVIESVLYSFLWLTINPQIHHFLWLYLCKWHFSCPTWLYHLVKSWNSSMFNSISHVQTFLPIQSCHYLHLSALFLSPAATEGGWPGCRGPAPHVGATLGEGRGGRCWNFPAI